MRDSKCEELNKMKGLRFRLAILISICIRATAQEPVPPEIEDASITQVNKLPPRSNMWSYPSVESAKAGDYGASPWVRSLNGTWKFHWCPRPEQRPKSFYETDYPTSDWLEIPVPSTWEREGHGTPLYVNIKYPFHVDPPRVMGEPDPSFTSFAERNPVGSYVRNFNVPDEWHGKRILLHFAGVQ